MFEDQDPTKPVVYDATDPKSVGVTTPDSEPVPQVTLDGKTYKPPSPSKGSQIPKGTEGPIEPPTGEEIKVDDEVKPSKFSLVDFGKAVRAKYTDDTEDGKDPYADVSDEDLAAAAIKKYPGAYDGDVDFKGSKIFQGIANELLPDKKELTNYEHLLMLANAPTEGKVRLGRDVANATAGDIQLDVAPFFSGSTMDPLGEYERQTLRKLGLPPDTFDFLAQHGFQNEWRNGIEPSKFAETVLNTVAEAKDAGKATATATIGIDKLMLAEGFRKGGTAGLLAAAQHLQDKQRQYEASEHNITPDEVAKIQAARRTASWLTGAMETVHNENQFFNNILNLAGAFDPGGHGMDKNFNLIPGAKVSEEMLSLPSNQAFIAMLHKNQTTMQAIMEAGPSILPGVAHLMAGVAGGEALFGATALGPTLGGIIGVQGDTLIANLDKPLKDQAMAQLVNIAMMGAGVASSIAQKSLLKYGIKIPEIAMESAGMAVAAGGAQALDPSATMNQIMSKALTGAAFPMILRGMNRIAKATETKPLPPKEEFEKNVLLNLGKMKSQDIIDELAKNNIDVPDQLKISTAKKRLDQFAAEAIYGSLGLREIYGPSDVYDRTKPVLLLPPATFGLREVNAQGKAKYYAATQGEAEVHLGNLQRFTETDAYKGLSDSQRAIINDEIFRLDYLLKGELPAQVRTDKVEGKKKAKTITTEILPKRSGIPESGLMPRGDRENLPFIEGPTGQEQMPGYEYVTRNGKTVQIKKPDGGYGKGVGAGGTGIHFIPETERYTTRLWPYEREGGPTGEELPVVEGPTGQVAPSEKTHYAEEYGPGVETVVVKRGGKFSSGPETHYETQLAEYKKTDEYKRLTPQEKAQLELTSGAVVYPIEYDDAPITFPLTDAIKAQKKAEHQAQGSMGIRKVPPLSETRTKTIEQAKEELRQAEAARDQALIQGAAAKVAAKEPTPEQGSEIPSQALQQQSTAPMQEVRKMRALPNNETAVLVEVAQGGNIVGYQWETRGEQSLGPEFKTREEAIQNRPTDRNYFVDVEGQPLAEVHSDTRPPTTEWKNPPELTAAQQVGRSSIHLEFVRGDQQILPEDVQKLFPNAVVRPTSDITSPRSTTQMFDVDFVDANGRAMPVPTGWEQALGLSGGFSRAMEAPLEQTTQQVKQEAQKESTPEEIAQEANEEGPMGVEPALPGVTEEASLGTKLRLNLPYKRALETYFGRLGMKEARRANAAARRSLNAIVLDPNSPIVKALDVLSVQDLQNVLIEAGVDPTLYGNNTTLLKKAYVRSMKDHAPNLRQDPFDDTYRAIGDRGLEKMGLDAADAAKVLGLIDESLANPQEGKEDQYVAAWQRASVLKPAEVDAVRSRISDLLGYPKMPENQLGRTMDRLNALGVVRKKTTQMLAQMGETQLDKIAGAMGVMLPSGPENLGGMGRGEIMAQHLGLISSGMQKLGTNSLISAQGRVESFIAQPSKSNRIVSTLTPSEMLAIRGAVALDEAAMAVNRRRMAMGLGDEPAVTDPSKLARAYNLLTENERAAAKLAHAKAQVAKEAQAAKAQRGEESIGGELPKPDYDRLRRLKAAAMMPQHSATSALQKLGSWINTELGLLLGKAPKPPTPAAFAAAFGDNSQPKMIIKSPSGSPLGPVVFMNMNMAGKMTMMIERAFPGLNLAIDNPRALEGFALAKVAAEVKKESLQWPTGSEEREQYESMATMLQVASTKPSATLMPVKENMPTDMYKEIRRHEYAHQEQFKLADYYLGRNPDGSSKIYQLTDAQWLADHPLAPKMLGNDFLSDNYHPAAWTTEAVAYAMSGDGARVGLTPSESAQLINDYRLHIAAKFGEGATGMFERMNPKVKKIIADEAVKEAKIYPCKS